MWSINRKKRRISLIVTIWKHREGFDPNDMEAVRVTANRYQLCIGKPNGHTRSMMVGTLGFDFQRYQILMKMSTLILGDWDQGLKYVGVKGKVYSLWTSPGSLHHQGSLYVCNYPQAIPLNFHNNSVICQIYTAWDNNSPGSQRICVTQGIIFI